MKKLELLEYLLNHKEYFKGVSLDDFCLLASLESSELGLMNQDNYKVTPLLKQISNYALVDTNVTQEDIEDIRNSLSSREEKFLESALDVANKCHQYVDILLKEGAHHPCIIKVNYLINGTFLYKTMMKIICNLIKITNDLFQDNLIDLTSIADDQVMDITDEMKEDLLQQVASRKMTSGVDLLRILSNYIKKILLIDNFLPFSSMDIHYSDDTYIQFIDREKIHPNYNLSIGDCIQCLSFILEQAHKYQEYSSDDKILDYIDDLEEEYHLYNSYRYLSVRNQYRENKMLEKCKKL